MNIKDIMVKKIDLDLDLLSCLLACAQTSELDRKLAELQPAHAKRARARMYGTQ